MRKTIIIFGFLGWLTLSAAGQTYCGISGDTSVHKPPNYDTMVPPARGASYTDPVFGCTVTRITDAIAQGFGSCSGASNCQGKHWYATVTPFNANDTYVMLNPTGASTIVAIPSGNVIVSQANMPANDGSVMPWDTQNANVFYYVNSNSFYMGTITGLPSCASGGTCTVASTKLYTNSSYSSVIIPSDEDISEDGLHIWVGLSATANIGQDGCQGNTCTIAMLTLNAGDGAATSASDNLSSLSGTAIASVTSWHKVQIALNNYVSIEGINGGNERREFTTAGAQYAVLDSGGHEDFSHRVTDGVEVNATLWYGGTTSNGCASEWGYGLLTTSNVTVYDCWSNQGNTSDLLSPASHISQRDTAQSLGWVIYSVDDGDAVCPDTSDVYCFNNPTSLTNWNLYSGEVVAIKNDGSQILRLAHHRSRTDQGYWAQTRASISRDAKYIIFDSNFNNCGDGLTCGAQIASNDSYNTDVYMITFQTGGNDPPNAPTGLTAVVQ